MQRIMLPGEDWTETPVGEIIADHFIEADTYAIHRPQGRADTLITYTLEGEGYVITPAGEQHCRAGDLMILRAGTPHQYGTVKGLQWNFVWAHALPSQLGPQWLPDEEVHVYSVGTQNNRKRIYRAFRRILSDTRTRGEHWNELCIGALREVLILTIGQQRQKMDPRVEEAIHLLSRYMKEPLRIDTLAKAVGLSPSRLSHLFKAQTGMSILDTLNRMRIRQAALLLEFSGRTAAEAAYEVGFHNYNHFINQFKKWQGVNPSTFVRGRQSR